MRECDSVRRDPDGMAQEEARCAVLGRNDELEALTALDAGRWVVEEEESASRRSLERDCVAVAREQIGGATWAHVPLHDVGWR
eukprot:5709003-Prymnesium_polylepis.2